MIFNYRIKLISEENIWKHIIYVKYIKRVYLYKIHICIKNRRPLVTFRYHFCPREKSLDIEENSVQDVCSQAENGLRDNGGPVFPTRTRYFSADSREKRSPGTGLKSYKVAGIRVRSVYPRELWRKKGGLGGNIIARWIVHARTFLIYPPLIANVISPGKVDYWIKFVPALGRPARSEG